MDKAELGPIKSSFIVKLEKPHAGEAEAAADDAEEKMKRTHKKRYAVAMIIVAILFSVLGQKWISLLLLVILSICLFLIDKEAEIMLAMYAAAPLPFGLRIVAALAAFLRLNAGPFQSIIDYLFAPIAGLLIGLASSSDYEPMVRKTWQLLFNQHIKGTNNVIDKYWRDLGLTNIPGSMVHVNAVYSKEPVRQYEGFNLTNFFPVPKYMLDHSELWAFSDITDAMHVKSLLKRHQAKKIEASQSSKRKFFNIMMQLTQRLPKVSLEPKALIRKALATEGSPGEFSKQTILEPIWKDHNVPLIMDLWEQLVKSVLQIASMGIELDESLIEYMLYRKIEIMKKDEQGNIKITRVMQACNLYLRVPDSVVFGAYNEAMVLSRFENPQKVGINVLTELKFIIPLNGKYMSLCMDFPDFDGHQSPYQMEANKWSRILYWFRNKEPVRYLYYLIMKYNIHTYRKVRSTAGIHLYMVGQQATGDITTSDDNTMRTATYCKMLEEVIKSEMNLEIKSSCQGDDTYFTVQADHETAGNEILKRANRVAQEIGWDTKPAELYQNGPQSGANFLGHVMRQIECYSELLGRICVPIATREGDRCSAKFLLAAEQQPNLTITTRENIVAKMMSYAVSLPGRPDIVAVAAFITIILRANPGKTKLSYSWRVNNFVPKLAFDVNNSIKLMIGLDLCISKISLTHIDGPKDQLIKSLAVLKSTIDRLAPGQSTVPLSYIIDFDWLYIDRLNDWVKQTMIEINSRSEIAKGKLKQNWWESEVSYSPDQSPLNLHKCKIASPRQKYCSHLNKAKYGQIKEHLMKSAIEIFQGPVKTAIFACNECYPIYISGIQYENQYLIHLLK